MFYIIVWTLCKNNYIFYSLEVVTTSLQWMRRSWGSMHNKLSFDLIMILIGFIHATHVESRRHKLPRASTNQCSDLCLTNVTLPHYYDFNVDDQES